MPELYSQIRDASDTPVSRFMKTIDQVRFNPSMIQRAMLAQIQDSLNGTVSIVDATNPFVMLMESAALNTASFIIANETTTRKQYPAAAQTVEDLYLHMSDKDYVDRFAVAASAKFRLFIAKQELLNRMVLDPATGISKVVIPRYSTVEISGYVFTLLYPVEIKQLAHGGLQVVYDTSEPNVLQPLTTNLIDWSVRNSGPDQLELLTLSFEALQLSVISVTAELNQISGFNKVLAFSDSYCYARVYYKNNATGNAWKEIQTTHTDQVYDINNPTAVLQVLDTGLKVQIPQIYLSVDGPMSGSLRVDVYSTKGAMQLNTSNFKPSAFTATWSPIDPADITPAVAAWQAQRSYFVFTNDVINGGANALDFETLRSRVITNSVGERQIPITGAQIQAALSRDGFDIVKYIDTITERTFLATRAMPQPSDPRLVTAAAASIESLIVSFQEAVTHSKVKDNGLRITLTPDILYENTNGIIRMVSEEDQASIMALDPDRRALYVSGRQYLFTPFHYVMDASGDTFETRPYYLESPTVEAGIFVDQNDSTLLQVNTNSFAIAKTAAGYVLTVQTVSNDSYKAIDDSQLFAQLSYTPVAEGSTAYLNGTVLGRDPNGEVAFQFLLDSNFDLDNNDLLGLTSFKVLNLDDRVTLVDLVKTFDLRYSTSAIMPPSWTSHQMDQELGRYLLPNRIAAITQERVNITFGQALKNLWCASRTIASSAPSRLYDTDVYATYSEDVYVVDPVTGSAFSIDSAGALVWNYSHRAGDLVVDSNGNNVIIHHAGDVMTDAAGNPIAQGEAFVSRQIDLFFLEGVYFFATDYSSQLYLSEVVATVVGWISNNLVAMSQELLEQTELFFYPKTNMGTIQAVIEGGSVAAVQASQSLAVRIFVSDTVFNNTELRDALTTATIEVIDANFQLATVSVSSIVAQLRQRFGEDVLSVAVTGLAGLLNLEALTLLESNQRCSIKKKLTALANGNLIVQEDVSVDFVKFSA